MSGSRVHTTVVMDTDVSIRTVADHDAGAVERAFEWFRRIESACSRFDPQSEIQHLASIPAGTAVEVGDIVFQTVRFALALAEETDGAFDPTIGARMEASGFDREYRSGGRVHTAIADTAVSYRDVHLDEATKTITLARPLVLDLGAVAKGFAIDMAAQELRPLENFAIDAGGDLYLGGHNEHGNEWSVGIRHPRATDQTIETLTVSNAAVCTSGDYLRRGPDGAHHILDPRGEGSAAAVASATVVAPIAMVADGLATAAFVLGPERGIALLERHGVQGLLITPSLERFTTRRS